MHRSRPNLGAAIVAVVWAVGLTSGPVSPADGPAALARSESIDVWRSDEGLPQNSVQCIAQTRDGYLWLGTHEGLVRFDGSRFTVFDAAGTDGLESSYVWTLFEDREGNLWIGTGGGGLTRYRDGAFAPLPADSSGGGLPHDMVSSVIEHPDGALWIGTYGGGLVRWDGKTFRTYSANDGLLSDLVRALLIDRRERLWIGTVGGGLHRLDSGGDRLIAYNADPGAGGDQNVYALHESRQGELWIGTDGGLRRVEQDRLREVPLDGKRVYEIDEDREGSLWIGTDSGLYRLTDGQAVSYGIDDGLSNEIVHAIHEDHEGSLWIGTGGGGLNRLRRGPFSTLASREGLSHDIVSAIYEDPTGVLWIGTWGGGLNGFVGGSFRSWTTRDGLSSNLVSALHQDRRGDLWIGTYDGGLNRLRDGKFTSYSTAQGLAHDTVWAVTQATDDALWVGTSGGLSRLEHESVSNYDTADGLSHAMVRALYQDPQGVLWIGTNGGGLSRFSHGRFTSLGRDQGLSSDLVYAIHEDARGVMWIGTYGGGLNRYSAGRFTPITTREGLCDDTVLRILEDDRGNLWMSSNRGVFRVRREEADAFAEGRADSVACTFFGTAAGMRSSECNGGLQPAGWKTRDGRLWFPTNVGAVVVDPADADPERVAPPVVVEGVVVDRQATDPRSPAVWRPGARDIEFHYTALSFLDPDRVRFRYLLEGYNEDWVEAGTRRAAYYTNLSPGEYRFRVRASNHAGVWSESGATFAFRLQPHYWQTRWFWALCGLIALFAGSGLYLARVQRLKRREQELERVVDERTHDLVEVTRRLEEANRRQADLVSGVSHDLKTPLTLIRLYGETLLHDTDAAERRKYCGVITREVERLSHLVDRVLNFSSVDRGRKEYRLRPGDLREAVEPTVAAYARYLGRQGFSVRQEMASGLPPARFDPDAVAEIVVNLMDNAAKYSGASREMEVRLFPRDGGTVLEVADRGTGIPPEERERIFEQFYRAPDSATAGGGYGLGLFLVRHVAEAHGASIELDSEVGRGSRFRVFFPPHTEQATG